MMLGYYAYLVGEDGHRTNRVTILAASDEEAKERAKQLADVHAVEAMAGRPQDRDIRTGAVRPPEPIAAQIT